MTRELIQEQRGVRRDRQETLVLTAAALTAALAVAAIVVSIGIARACDLGAALITGP